MPEIPEEMKMKDRKVDPVFLPKEWLYRRVPHIHWADDEVLVESLDLPDMSVNRGKYGPPEWVRLTSDEHADWGVIGFRVESIPSPIKHVGMFEYDFQPVHCPHAKNYPHSEVQVYETHLERHTDPVHITKSLANRIRPDVLLRFREKLARECQIIIKAGPRGSAERNPA